MNSPKYCLDTHPLVWYFTGQKTLSNNAKRALDDIFSGKAVGYIPSIVLLQTFHLSLKKKHFIFPDFIRKLRLGNIIIVPLDKTVLAACYKQTASLDIHDRIIAAASKVNSSILITKDASLLKNKTLKTLW